MKARLGRSILFQHGLLQTVPNLFENIFQHYVTIYLFSCAVSGAECFLAQLFMCPSGAFKALLLLISELRGLS